MTKEQKQAIEYLKADIKYWEDTSVSTDHLIMAIKAIEQQPCEDCVSRQKVKDGMRKYGFHSPDMTITEFVEDELLPVTPTHGTCKDCKHCGAYLCGYTCYKGHWGKISTKGNYGGMGDFYCADFEKRGNENGRNN